MGVAPIISYQYGAKNKGELRRVMKLCLFLVGSISVVLFVICALIAPVITGLYAKQGSAAYQIAVSGFQIFMFCFLFNGLSIFASAVFTALSNGKVSAILSFVRTFILLTVFLLVFPYFFGVNGIWLATPSADFLGALLSVVLLLGIEKNILAKPM